MQPTRYVIDFQGMDVVEASKYSEVFDRIKNRSCLIGRRQPIKRLLGMQGIGRRPEGSSKLAPRQFSSKVVDYVVCPRGDGGKGDKKSYPDTSSADRLLNAPSLRVPFSPDIRPNAACVVFAHAKGRLLLWHFAIQKFTGNGSSTDAQLLTERFR